ncbi:hypothetical protein IW492_01980 [Enterococcus sp. BWB1-3]|uniref:hypothetical protein n=1 Tax=Enterococcus sp. BWB1-3 TaxID=2787713 RepID=UPI0019231A4F|nr:hypothetical protein [Enterococcus sp. BWB1-3]MBL1227998.1 hypothetical protein [Enterococcus sp. BWB1-3]
MQQLKFDYGRLEKKVAQSFDSSDEFLQRIQMNGECWYRRINEGTFFRQSEIATICDVLKIENSEIADYFFYIENQENLINVDKQIISKTSRAIEREEGLLQGKAAADYWYHIYEPLIRIRQFIERIEKQDIPADNPEK